MIQVKVELEDEMDESLTISVTLPCNLRAKLNPEHKYSIVDCDPDLNFEYGEDVEALNQVLDRINCENPEMTAEYLTVLLENTNARDLFDEDFLRRIEENDFMFEDITGIERASPEETAGYYLAERLKIPFDHGITEELLNTITSPVLENYINWYDVWNQYERMGFQIADSAYGLFILHWK